MSSLKNLEAKNENDYFDASCKGPHNFIHA